MTSSKECPKKPAKLSGHKREELEELVTWVVKASLRIDACTDTTGARSCRADGRPAAVKGASVGEAFVRGRKLIVTFYCDMRDQTRAS